QPASTLRYYEEQGLIESVGRRGLKRTYEANVLYRLALVALGRAAGFSLAEIMEMFRGRRGLEIDRKKLELKAGELDEQIAQLTTIRDALRSTARCPAGHHLDCPNFQRVVRSAGKGRLPPLKQTPTKRTSKRVR
ncbi:MAG: MerR family DNA-binding protein, partial [Pseudomonadota bacterium]